MGLWLHERFLSLYNFIFHLFILFEFIQKSDDKERLRGIIESQEKFHHIDVATVDLINTYTATNISTENAEGGKINMCKAIQEMIEDGRAEGQKEGCKKGRNKRDTEINRLIDKLRATGASADQILRAIEQTTRKKAPRSRKKTGILIT